MTSPIHTVYSKGAFLRVEEFRDLCLAPECPRIFGLPAESPFDARLPTGKFSVDDPSNPTLVIAFQHYVDY